MASLQPGLDVDETCSETSDGCLSVHGRNADRRTIGMVHVGAMAGDNEIRLICAEKIQQRAQYRSLQNANR